MRKFLSSSYVQINRQKTKRFEKRCNLNFSETKNIVWKDTAKLGISHWKKSRNKRYQEIFFSWRQQFTDRNSINCWEKEGKYLKINF